MTAHNPITAAKAVAMVEAIGAADARRLIADHAAAGLVKSYALVIETAEVEGPRQTVRGSTVPVALWRRMIREAATGDVWGGGTVRLAAGELVGGLPEVDVTGVVFERRGIVALMHHLDGGEPTTVAPPPEPLMVSEDASGSATSPLRQRRRPNPDAIPPGALLATVNQTMAALGLGRTKVNELMNSGRLQRVEIDGGVRITTGSIHRLITERSSAPSESHNPV